MDSNKKLGRPTIYTTILADEICDAISSSEKGLRQLCEENPHWPDRSNIFIWLRRYSEFQDQYTRAKEHQVEVSVDYMTELMNEPHYFVDDKGRTRVDSSLLRTKMDAIKWQSGKLKPKKYGDIKLDESQEKNAAIHEDTKKRKQELDEEKKKDY